MRQRSPVYRYGGDEFAVILKDHDLEQIDSLVRRFRDDLKAQRNREGDEPWLKISAAIGYAVFDPAVDDDANRVFQRADKAMYEDKMRSKG
ncbi:MAG: diguanylate cyclase [Eubacterium sp.]|nr:diguanylate cyclase [Eubacterium sp.]